MTTEGDIEYCLTK